MVAEQKKIHASPPRSCLLHAVCRTLFILYSPSCLSACSDDHHPAATYFIELIHDRPLFIEAEARLRMFDFVDILENDNVS